MRTLPTKLSLAFLAGSCMLAVLATGCNDQKSSTSTEVKTDTTVTPVIDNRPVVVPDSSHMQKMDTGETKPIVPGT